jgi:hypothetical protein
MTSKRVLLQRNLKFLRTLFKKSWPWVHHELSVPVRSAMLTSLSLLLLLSRDIRCAPKSRFKLRNVWPRALLLRTIPPYTTVGKGPVWKDLTTEIHCIPPQLAPVVYKVVYIGGIAGIGVLLEDLSRWYKWNIWFLYFNFFHFPLVT